MCNLIDAYVARLFLCFCAYPEALGATDGFQLLDVQARYHPCDLIHRGTLALLVLILFILLFFLRQLFQLLILFPVALVAVKVVLLLLLAVWVVSFSLGNGCADRHCE